MLSHARSARRGFTLAEVLVAFALIAILAAVMLPTVRGRLQDGYENALVQEMTSLATAITAYRQDVGKYPRQLDYLTALPTGATDFCGRALTPADSVKWRGPYVSRIITNAAVYVVAQKDSVQDLLARPVGNNAIIQIVISGADTATAHDVDLKIDGTVSKTAGSLLWVVNGAATTMSYAIPTRPNAC